VSQAFVVCALRRPLDGSAATEEERSAFRCASSEPVRLAAKRLNRSSLSPHPDAVRIRRPSLNGQADQVAAERSLGAGGPEDGRLSHVLA